MSARPGAPSLPQAMRAEPRGRPPATEARMPLAHEARVPAPHRGAGAVLPLCVLVSMLDGFDTQVISYVAPAIAHLWKVPISAFGPVFGAGLLGLTLGSLFLGPIADRAGRKTVIIVSTIAFGLFSLATAWCDGMDMLLVLRFLTGLGLGAAMPNLVALVGEHAPPEHRARAITIMFAGVPLGAALGGLTTAQIVDIAGWRSVFLFGGTAPLVLAAIMLPFLPESPELARQRDGDHGRAQRFSAIGRIGDLFRDGRATATALLWVAYFTNLLVMYFLISWLPLLFRSAGLSTRIALASSAMLTLGGVAGGFVLGQLIDRLGPYRVLAPTSALAALCVALISGSGTHAALLFVTVFLAGFGIIGSQIGLNVIASGLYPTAIRATGVSWALGIGRIGSVIGPVIGGLFLAGHWAPSAILLLVCIPACVTATMIALLGISRSRAARRG